MISTFAQSEFVCGIRYKQKIWDLLFYDINRNCQLTSGKTQKSHSCANELFSLCLIM
jgi:hypothetical protein